MHVLEELALQECSLVYELSEASFFAPNNFKIKKRNMRVGIARSEKMNILTAFLIR